MINDQQTDTLSQYFDFYSLKFPLKRLKALRAIYLNNLNAVSTVKNYGGRKIILRSVYLHVSCRLIRKFTERLYSLSLGE